MKTGSYRKTGTRRISHIALMRMRVAAAESRLKEAKEHLSSAKRRRKLARLLAKRAKKDAKQAKANHPCSAHVAQENCWGQNGAVCGCPEKSAGGKGQDQASWPSRHGDFKKRTNFSARRLRERRQSHEQHRFALGGNTNRTLTDLTDEKLQQR
jgi:hypothetical protein